MTRDDAWREYERLLSEVLKAHRLYVLLDVPPGCSPAEADAAAKALARACTALIQHARPAPSTAGTPNHEGKE
jgi:hypothetical protein